MPRRESHGCVDNGEAATQSGSPKSERAALMSRPAVPFRSAVIHACQHCFATTLGDQLSNSRHRRREGGGPQDGKGLVAGGPVTAAGQVFAQTLCGPGHGRGTWVRVFELFLQEVLSCCTPPAVRRRPYTLRYFQLSPPELPACRPATMNSCPGGNGARSNRAGPEARA